MQELTAVAICIPTFNQAHYLPESVGSACSQTYANVEVWVSDDASTDETPEVMAQLCQQFPQVRYYRQPENLGIAANNTWLLSQPTTEFIVRLDSDDVLTPHYVETLLALMQQYLEAGYAHTAIQMINERGENLSVARVARQKEFQDSEKALRVAVSGYRVAANICMFRAQALRQLKFYEKSPSYTEDYDLAVRMADAGYGNVYADQVLAYYRDWTDVVKTRPKRKKIQLQGYIQIFEKSLLPAFQRRGWDTKSIYRQRRQFAIRHAAYCYLPLFNEAERTELVALLKQLGDSPALRLRLLVLSWGLAPFFEWQLAKKSQLKSTVKGWLSKLKSFSSSEFRRGDAK